MKGKGMIAVAVLLIIALLAMPLVEAKTYNDFGGHSAVQYYKDDLGFPLNRYVERIEYDTIYNTGLNRYGVRLYLTPLGKSMIATSNQYGYVASMVTNYIGSQPEWHKDRSWISVSTEILYHAQWGKQIVHIQYHYQDLEFWEKPFYGRI
jgi:hypothetical protein